MQPVLAAHVHSAYLKRTGDDKLQQISTAKELLKLGDSLDDELNSSLQKLEHLHKEPQCQHNRYSAADVRLILIICICGHIRCLGSSPGSGLCRISHRSCRALSRLNICYGSLPGARGTQTPTPSAPGLPPPAKRLIKEDSCRADLHASQCCCMNEKQGYGVERIEI